MWKLLVTHYIIYVVQFWVTSIQSLYIHALSFPSIIGLNFTYKLLVLHFIFYIVVLCFTFLWVELSWFPLLSWNRISYKDLLQYFFNSATNKHLLSMGLALRRSCALNWRLCVKEHCNLICFENIRKKNYDRTNVND